MIRGSGAGRGRKREKCRKRKIVLQNVENLIEKQRGGESTYYIASVRRGNGSELKNTPKKLKIIVDNTPLKGYNVYVNKS